MNAIFSPSWAGECSRGQEHPFPFPGHFALEREPLRSISPTLLCSFIRYGGQCLPGYYLKGLRSQRTCNYLIIYSESKGMVADLLLR